jgi:hypothetical protein
MCADCKADLARVHQDLEDMTIERNQLLAIVDAAMNVVTPEQFMAMRARIAERDAGGDSAV